MGWFVTAANRLKIPTAHLARILEVTEKTIYSYDRLAAKVEILLEASNGNDLFIDQDIVKLRIYIADVIAERNKVTKSAEVIAANKKAEEAERTKMDREERARLSAEEERKRRQEQALRAQYQARLERWHAAHPDPYGGRQLPPLPKELEQWEREQAEAPQEPQREEERIVGDEEYQEWLKEQGMDDPGLPT